MSVDHVTLSEIAAIVVAALGGREGIKIAVNRWRNEKASSNGFVTKSFCSERHGNTEEKVREIKTDLKELREGQINIANDVRDILHRMP